MKILDYEGIKQIVEKIKKLLDLKANKKEIDFELEKINEKIRYVESNVSSDMMMRIKQLENAIYEDITGNPFTIKFKDIDGIVLTNGVFNESGARLEC